MSTKLFFSKAFAAIVIVALLARVSHLPVEAAAVEEAEVMEAAVAEASVAEASVAGAVPEE